MISMKGKLQSKVLLGISVAASAACLTLIETKPVIALDYAKCDSMGKAYAELKAYRDAEMEAVPGWVDESKDPDGYAKWRAKVIKAGDPYDVKMMSVRNDAISEGCIKQ